MENIVIGAVLLGGVYHLLFGTFHLFFPFALRWRETLVSLDGTNRNLLPVFNLWIAYAIYAWSAVSFAYPEQIAYTPLGHGICWTIAGVWIFRHMMQVYLMGFSDTYVFPQRYLGMKGIHALAFVPIYTIGTVLYLIPVLQSDTRAWSITAAVTSALMFGSWLLHRARVTSVSPRQDAGFAYERGS